MAEPRRASELDADACRRVCEPDSLNFSSTADVEPLEGTVGQARANAAIAFGLEIDTHGYNVFATGPVGAGKRTALDTRLREFAARRDSPGDWVYLHNFRDPRRPLAVALPSGAGREFEAEMHRFIEDARRELTNALESDTYAQRQRTVTEPIEHERETAFSDLRERARTGGIAIELTPAGLVTVPLRGTHPMTPQEFADLPESVRRRYEATIAELAPDMQTFVTHMRGLQRDGRDRLRELEREVALFAIGHLIDELKARHGDSPKLADWLTAVSEDVIENLSAFRAPVQGASEPTDGAAAAYLAAAQSSLTRYEVNVFVAHDHDGGAPVIVETNPTYPNLFGRIEHHGVFGGGFATDHRMLRAGAIHRANGGYLMLPAEGVIGQPLIWRKLKDVLRSNSIRLENPADEYALLPTTSLNPEPIDLDLKAILIGSPSLYDLAYRLDEDVRKLFRVKAEFESRTPWDSDGERAYATFVSGQAREQSLLDFDAGAVAAVVEFGGRLVESRDWLSSTFVEVAGLVAEASHWAARDGAELVSAEHVGRAFEERVGRSNLIERRLLEMVAEGTLLLDVDGTRVGQVNGLSVLDIGDYSFGHPMRITASAGPGRDALISIEREIELSGAIHDKGFLTLSGYLRRRYGGEHRIAISATLTFEQSYDRIDGDSAACAELYALLSELAGVPLRQDIAITGSVNQHGEVQAIGGVNDKIEGFFRVCTLAGLTGTQGVLIPEANVRHLMLSHEVTAAVADGRFHVWSARTIDEGIALLAGIPAGEQDGEGHYPPGTIHARVTERLQRFAEAGKASGTDGAHA